MDKKKGTTHWNITVPTRLNGALEKALHQGTYRTKNEYVRDAVRRMLESQQSKDTRPAPAETPL